MRRTPRTGLPSWLSSASVAWTGAILAALVVLLGVGFVGNQRLETESRNLQANELLARMLQDHADRTFDSLDIALATTIRSLRDRPGPTGATWIAPALTETQGRLPFVRSLSLLDSEGRVLASSVPDNEGIVVDLRRAPLPGPADVDRMGPLVQGRDLADLAAGGPRAAGRGLHDFMTVARLASEPFERPVHLVAVLNTDYFANAHTPMLADPARSAALVGLDGVLVSATEGIALRPGAALQRLRLFTEFLPAQESGSYVDDGIDGARAVTAFRTLRRRPLAVVVEKDHAAVASELAGVTGGVAAVCLAALAVIGAMAGMAWRSLRSHELVRRNLEASEERAASSEDDLRLLVESVQELIFRSDLDGRVTFVNRRWAEISGRPSAAIVGRHLADVCHADDRLAAEAVFEAGATRDAGTRMVRVEQPGGEVRTLEVSVTPVRDECGVALAFAGCAVDVSERELARKSLVAQVDFGARLLEVNPTPLFVKDREGRFVTVNQAWLALMDFSLDGVIGRTSEELFGDEAPLHADQDRRLMQTQGRVEYENRLKRPGRPDRDTRVAKVRFTHADGTPAGIVGSIVDITEFREAERTTREARDAAERSDRAKSEFIANISHELRTPLQSIIGFSELGREMPGTEADVREMFGDVLAGGQRMLKLVNALLDVAKIDSAVGSLALQRLDVVALFEAVVREMRALATLQELAFEVAAPTRHLPADVEPTRIQQVFRNVLANAMRFAPKGSTIDIDFADRADGGIEIAVRDRGPGIPADELEAVFAAFVQSSRTRDGSGGTGLGLTICRKIMSAHGGTIVAGNAPGGGACLRIGLPPPAAEAQGAPATAPEAEPAYT
jgi:PAS domain S-box-containing protein